MAEALTLDTIDIIGPDGYVENGYPHEAWKLLRREAPIFYWDRGVQLPFYAVTKHEDIIHISKQPRLFQNGPRMAVIIGGDGPPEEGPTGDDQPLIRQLLNMDPPEHGKYRKVASGWFTPRGITRLEQEVERITRELIDDLRDCGGEADFVESVTAPLTLSVLADMLGVPRQDWRLMVRWTNQIAGSSDPEYQEPGKTPFETVRSARESLFKYFAELSQKRIAEPRDDVVSVIANARVDGKPIPPLELLSFYLVLVVAGNETTRNAASGGLLALIENPAELEKLRADPALIDSAVEEIVRWTNPVIQFCRTPVEDFELQGQKIRAGQSMCLFYPSANRDEEVFDDPFHFDIERSPNDHLAFGGYGAHFCLGASLARLEAKLALGALLDRTPNLKLVSEDLRYRPNFLLRGLEALPVAV